MKSPGTFGIDLWLFLLVLLELNGSDTQRKKSGTESLIELPENHWRAKWRWEKRGFGIEP